MPKTLLQAVNSTLKRARIIQGDAGELTSFTDSQRQNDIDLVIQLWNEIIHQMYGDGLFAIGTDEDTITLVDDTNNTARTEYSLASDFEEFAMNVMTDQTNGRIMTPYPGGYSQMFSDQINPTNFTGIPLHYTINPSTGDLRLSAHPQTGDAGGIYTYVYKKRLSFTAETCIFPFSDTVVDSLVPAVVWLYRRDKQLDFDQREFNKAYNRAVSIISPFPNKKTYGRRSAGTLHHHHHGHAGHHHGHRGHHG